MDVFAFKRHRANQTKECLRAWMQLVCSAATSEGVPMLLQVVADGPKKHRISLMREAVKGNLAIDENVCNMVFKFFCEQVQKAYGVSAGKALDNLDVSTPETDKEFQARVDRSWTFESASSEMAKRLLQLPSGTGGSGSPVVSIPVTES